MVRSHVSRAFRLVLGLLVVMTLAGCGDGGTPVTEPATSPLSEDPARYGTWAWEGSNWSQLAPTSFGEHDTGSDLYPAELEYWKGVGGLIALDRAFPFDPAKWANVDMWNGSGWVHDDAFPSPPPNEGADLIFDPANDQLITVGAHTVWAWSHGRWVSVVSPERWTLPDALGVGQFAYDPYRREVLILMCCQPPSGPVDESKPCSFGPCEETWAWNGHALTRLSATPIPNDTYTLVPDDSGHILAFGYPQDFSWDGKSWSPLASGLSCPKSSANLTTLQMAYDVAHKQLIAVGRDTHYGFHMWHWVEGAWEEMSPAGTPPRGLDSIVYDPMLPGLVLTVEPPPSRSLSGSCTT